MILSISYFSISTEIRYIESDKIENKDNKENKKISKIINKFDKKK